MAVTRVSSPVTVFQATVGSASTISDDYALERLSDGRMVVVYKTIAPATYLGSLYETILNPAGTTHTAPVLLATEPQSGAISIPHIAAGVDGKFLVGWDLNRGMTLDSLWRPMSASGAPLSIAGQTSTQPGGIEAGQSIALLGNGNYLMTWSDSGTSPIGPGFRLDVMGRIVSASGQALGGEFKISPTGSQSHGAGENRSLANGQTLVFYEDTNLSVVNGELISTEVGLSGRLMSANGTPGAAFTIDTITSGKEYDDTQVVALGNGSFVVGWIESYQNGSKDEVHIQQFSSAGAKIGGEKIVASVATGSGSDTLDLVGLANGGFAMHWVTSNYGHEQDHLRVFDKSGVQVGGDIDLAALSRTGGPGLYGVHDLELMANGHVRAVGTDMTGKSVLTQEFDLGDERLLGSTVADTLYGKNGVHDYILGYSGNDLLKGLTGNDTLDGGTGNDTLIGGGGSDSFVFATVPSATANRDTIADFNVAADTIKLENGVFAAFAAQAANTVIAPGAFWSNATGAAHDADDRIIYNSSTGVLSYDSNGSAAGGTIWEFAKITPGLALTNADFVVV